MGNARTRLAAAVLAGVISAGAPAAARADDLGEAGAAWTAPILRDDVLHPRVELVTRQTLAVVTSRLPAGSVTTDLALSRGAKIAIIVGAIVLGVIIVFSIVAIGPGRHGP